MKVADAQLRPKKLAAACCTASAAGNDPNMCGGHLLTAAADALRVAVLPGCETNRQSPLLLDNSACNSCDGSDGWGRPNADSTKQPPRLHAGSSSAMSGACFQQCRECEGLRAVLAQKSAELESDHVLMRRASAALEQREAEAAILRSRVAAQAQQIQELLCRLQAAEPPRLAAPAGACWTRGSLLDSVSPSRLGSQV